MAVAVSSQEFEHHVITHWVLLVESNLVRQHRMWHALEGQGFGVVIVVTLEEARGCLAVMRPALVVAGDLPGARDFLDGARAVGIEAASYRDIVGKQLA
jgi:hypothetical protein